MGAILDPGGIFTGDGFLADTGSPYAPTYQSQGNNGFLSDMFKHMGSIQNAAKQHNAFDNFAQKAGEGPGGAAGAINLDVKVAPPSWQSQWSYAPGKGPQWIEPQRVSSDNSVPYAAVVNNGPAKGNRF